MSIHLATVNGAPVSPREATVRRMASYLLAGVTAGGLDLSSDFHVIRYLTNTPERYRAKVVTSHMDDAVYQVRQTLIMAQMMRPV